MIRASGKAATDITFATTLGDFAVFARALRAKSNSCLSIGPATNEESHRCARKLG
jgi:hypothetical protein